MLQGIGLSDKSVAYRYIGCSLDVSIFKQWVGIMGGSRDFYTVFFESTRQDIACLQRALGERNRVLALHFAHRLHGSALVAGVCELAGLAATLEQVLSYPLRQDNDWSHLLGVAHDALDCLNNQLK